MSLLWNYLFACIAVGYNQYDNTRNSHLLFISTDSLNCFAWTSSCLIITGCYIKVYLNATIVLTVWFPNLAFCRTLDNGLIKFIFYYLGLKGGRLWIVSDKFLEVGSVFQDTLRDSGHAVRCLTIPSTFPAKSRTFVTPQKTNAMMNVGTLPEPSV